MARFAHYEQDLISTWCFSYEMNDEDVIGSRNPFLGILAFWKFLGEA